MKCTHKSRTHCIFQEDDSQGRYEPAKIQSLSAVREATQRYYKLHGGDVIDIETGTILDREALLKILD